MLLSLLSSGNIRDAIISILLTLPAVLIAISFHEAAHAYAAYKLGDRTAHNLGRLTFNPIKHIDPFGFLCMLVFGYGWAKPVPINPRNFKNARRGMAFTAIAGPMMNLLIGIISTIIYTVIFFYFGMNIVGIIYNGFTAKLVWMALMLFQYMAILNFMLMAYNMIPVPPFDGSRFFGLLLPQRIYWSIMRYERHILVGVILVSVILSRFFDFSPFAWIAENLFEGIANLILKLLVIISN